LLLGSVLLSSFIVRWAIGTSRMARIASDLPESEPAKWANPELPAGLDDKVFAGGSASGRTVAGELARRYRLAGTFFVLSDDGTESRRAVVDDSASQVQKVVAEGDTLGDVSVVRIFQDHAVLRRGGIEEDLWLTFVLGEGAAEKTNAPVAAASGAANDGPAAKFGGRKIGDNRWVFSRASLMDYYGTLSDNPERMVAVFDSLKPMYTDGGRINGYRLGVEGEGDFFDAVGLRQGDIVYRANSLDMTNRRRAEFLIKQFVDGNSNAYVLDIRRGDEDLKLIYEIR
jgi:hypothetical protein